MVMTGPHVDYRSVLFCNFLQGALFRVPYGFFDQPKLYMEQMFKEIGDVNDCELRALRGWCS